MTKAELYALIDGLALESEKRSGSAYVDERQQAIRATVEQLRQLPPEYLERRSGQDRRNPSALDGDTMGRRISVRRGSGGMAGGGVYRGIAKVEIDNPPTTVLDSGATYQLTFTITWTKGLPRSPDSIVWSSDDEAVATVDSSGLVTCQSPVSVDTANITVTVDGIRTDTVAIQVAPDSGAVVTSVAIIPPTGLTSPFTLAVAATLQLGFEVYDGNSQVMAGETVTWATGNGSVATVNSSGLVTGAGTGTTTITATSDTDPTKSDSVSVTVAAATADSVVVTPASFSLAVGQTVQLTAVTKAGTTVLSGRGAHTWASSSGSIATVSSSGVVTAVAEGNVTITATDPIDGGLSDTSAGTVTAAVTTGQRESPTGRRPRFAWSLELQDVWSTMYEAYLADPTGATWDIELVAGAVGVANLSNTPDQRYGDNGLCATWLYQASGDPVWGDIAVTRFLSAAAGFATNSVDEDDMREQYMNMVFMWDRLYPRMSASQRTSAASILNDWALSLQGIHPSQTPPYDGGFGSGDTDGITGNLGGATFHHYLDVAENNWYLGLLDEQVGLSHMVLGDVTGEAVDTARAKFRTFFTTAAYGGNWMEGSQYNDGTSHLALFAVLGLRTAGAQGNGPTDLSASHPEADAWIADAVVTRPHTILHTYKDEDEWGDDSSPRSLQHGRMFQFIAQLSYAGTSTDGQWMQRFAKDFYDANKTQIIGDMPGSTVRAMTWLNPYKTAAVGSYPYASAPVAQMIGDVNQGIGHYTIKGADYYVSLRACNKHKTDHPFDPFCDIRVWTNRGGSAEWALDHPIGYSGILTEVQAHNSVMLAGLGGMNGLQSQDLEGRGYKRHASGTTNSIPWFCVVAQNKGSFPSLPFYQPPPGFADAERRMFFFDDPGTSDLVVIVWDKVVGHHPFDDQLIGNATFVRSNNFDVQNNGSPSYYDDQTLRTLAAGTVFDTGTSKTITASKWSAAKLCITKGGSPTASVEWASSSYDSQALAEAALPATPSGTIWIGTLAVQASASGWTAGTDALKSGTGGNPASQTVYANYQPYKFDRYRPLSGTGSVAPFTKDDKKRIVDSWNRTSGTVAELLWHCPSTPTITDPSYSEVTTGGGRTLRFTHLAPTATTSPSGSLERTIIDTNTWVANPDSVGKKILLVSTDNTADTMQFVTVITIGTGTPPTATLIGDDPDVVQVGGLRVTFNASDETVAAAS